MLVKCPNCKSEFDSFDVPEGRAQCPNCGNYVNVGDKREENPLRKYQSKPPAGRKSMRTIAFVNHKSEVGKTVSVINVGGGLQRLGRKALLVDLDPQARLTYGVGIIAYELKTTIYDVLCGKESIRNVLASLGGMGVIPSCLDLCGVEMELSGTVGREFLLKKSLGDLQGYDYVLIDCPSSLGLLTLNALVAAHEVYIPIQTEVLALQGMAKLTQMIETVKDVLNPGLDVTGAIATRYDSSRQGNTSALEIIRDLFRDRIFSTVIRHDPSVAEAVRDGQTVFQFDAKCSGAQDYESLCKEIVNRCERPG